MVVIKLPVFLDLVGHLYHPAPSNANADDEGTVPLRRHKT